MQNSYIMIQFNLAVVIIVAQLMNGSPVNGIPLEDFYPFGEHTGDTALARQPWHQPDIYLSISTFPFFGNEYTSLRVNAYGYITFSGRSNIFTPQPFPLTNYYEGTTLISLFMTRSGLYFNEGNVWYRETNNATLLERAKTTIQAACIDHVTFEPLALFIATWDHIHEYYYRYYRVQDNATNTFQCVLATDGVKSFAIFLYADGEIQWLRDRYINQFQYYNDPPPQVGINSGANDTDGVRFFNHPDTRTTKLVNITDTSNIENPGVWLLRLDGEGDISKGCSGTVNFESVPLPPDEGNGAGVAALLKLAVNPAVMFNESEYIQLRVHLTVVATDSENATEEADFTLDTVEFTFILNATEFIPTSSGDNLYFSGEYMVVTKEIIVTPFDDLLVEGTESYSLSIANVSEPGSIGSFNTITINIKDNDFAAINIESVTSPLVEGDGTGIAGLLRLMTDPSTAILEESVIIHVEALTIVVYDDCDEFYDRDYDDYYTTCRPRVSLGRGEDLSLINSELIFAANSGNNDTKNIVVSLSDDVFVEGTESYRFSISLSSGVASIGTNRITVDIRDNEGATVNIESIESPPGEGDEAGIAAVVRLTIEPTTTLLGDSINVQVIVMTGASVTAFEGADFSLNTKTLNFPKNSVNDATRDILLTPIDDILIEGTESYVLSIRVVGPATVGVDTVTMNIVDNDGSTEEDVVNAINFINVTAFDNMNELLREEDSVSDPIYIPRPGMLYGERVVSTAYVNENGIISFNVPWRYSYPERFPTSNFNIRNSGLAVAPFWSDVDIRKSGVIKYATFSAAESSRNTSEHQEFERVNEYVNSNLPDDGTNSSFSGTWMLVAHWENVHSSPHGANNPPPLDGLNSTNNFQGIIITNVSHTFAIFNYICGELQWNGFGRDNLATVGYIASRDIFSNHPLSGFSSINHSVSCSTDGTQIGQTESLIQVIGVGNNDWQERLDTCLRGQLDDVVFESVGIPNAISHYAALLEPCPPDENLARLDIGKFIPFGTSDNPHCYVTGKPLRIPLPQLSQYTITQQCCYIAGGLVTNKDPMAGGMLLYHPIIDEDNYRTYDEAFRRRCCSLGSPFLCEKYFELRPASDGSGYQPPVVAWGSGDPHFRTFDGRYFDFQGLGEFYSMNALDGNGSIIFSLQGRQSRLYGSNRVTWHTAVAFGQPDEIAYELDASNFAVYQSVPTVSNYSKPEITSELVYGVPRYDNQTKSVLIRTGNKLTAAFFESGVVLEANRWGPSISWTIRVPRELQGRTEGILGLYDGDQSNDFRLRNGTNLSQTISERELYNHYIDSWSVSENERMFFTDSKNRGKRQALNDSEFEPVFFSDLEFSDDQVLVCEGNPQCLFDFSITNDKDVGVQALNDEKEANATIDLLENVAPNISALSLLRVNLNEETVYTIEVIDPGDNVTLTLQGGLPLNSILEFTEEGEYIFRWTLQELTNDPLVFVATDTRNASSTHTPTVELCACVNDGFCTLDGVLTANATITMACLCNEAFSGQFCEEDRNGCSEIQCYEGVECLDVPAPGTGAVCGACPLGFTGDGLKCYDINECELNVTGCEVFCVNTEGSYHCDCSEGYQIFAMTQCEDLDECVENLHDYEQVCENTVGSYNCSCEPGFTLSSDSRNCAANQPCSNNGGCSHTCAVVNGTEQCFCPLGLQLPTLESLQCIDVNECFDSTCTQSCVNTYGSFKCACNDGYSLLSDGRNCEDVDECRAAALGLVDLCVDDPNTQCRNIEGSFECTCVSGYIRENGTCQVIEEEPPPPPPAATPPNGLESSVSFLSPTLMNISNFTPQKQQQFREVTANAVVRLCMNTTCAVVTSNGDIEERYSIQLRPRNVAIPTGIINQVDDGGLNITFYVLFNDGSVLHVDNLTTAVEVSVEEYRNVGFLDVDECIVNNGGCEQVCINIVNSFYCTCNDGFTLNSNGVTCDDIDECSTDRSNCHQICTNTIGSFSCHCDVGFSLNIDGATCDDIDECSINNGNCDHICINSVGSFNCSCENGFLLNADGSTCDDIDECSVDKGGCDQVCTNTVGSFICSCNEGFLLSADGSTCDETELLPKIEEKAGLLVTLDGYSIETFTVDVQRSFKFTTAMVLNVYCGTYVQECETSLVPVLKRKRQSNLFTEEDVVIANIIELQENGHSSVQFELYVLLEEDVSILSKDVVQLAVQDNTGVYHSAGFSSVYVNFLVEKGLSTAKIIGITIGSFAAVVLLILLVVMAVSCIWRSHSKSSKQLNGQLDFMNPNYKDDDVPNVHLKVSSKEGIPHLQCVSITFKQYGDYGLTQPKPDHEKEECI